MSESITRAPFAIGPGARRASVFTFTNDRGMQVRASSYGGVILSLLVPDRRGRLDDVVLGHASPDAYRTNAPYFGALIGRYANRIAAGRFTLDGRTYTLAVNDGPNHLHGGRRGFDKATWRARPFRTRQGIGVALARTSADGEEGYPGALRVRVTYTLTPANELIFDYVAVADRPTPVNLTQHGYFNLAGHGAGDILEHVVTVNADRFTPIDATMIPLGELRAVAGTPFELRQTPIGARINERDEQLVHGLGFDHNFVLNRADPTVVTLAARVFEPVSGRVLEVHTTEPGMQLYTGNRLNGEAGKEGVRYGPRAGLALETQHFPDSPNQPHFPSTILRPGDEYRSRTILRFAIG